MSIRPSIAVGIQQYIPVLSEAVSFLLLLSAAVFSFLSWRWYKLESRLDRENLLRERFVTNDVGFRLPQNASLEGEPYTSYHIFSIRVIEESGSKYFLKKALLGRFEGFIEISFTVVEHIGDKMYESRARTAQRSPGLRFVQRKYERLPDDFEDITEHEDFEDIGIDVDQFDYSGNTFNAIFQTADPDEIDEKLNDLIQIIAETCHPERSED